MGEGLYIHDEEVKSTFSGQQHFLYLCALKFKSHDRT